MNERKPVYRCLITAFLFLFCLAGVQPLQAAKNSEKTIVILIRHGETDHNRYDLFQGRADTALNDIGLQQADLLAESMKDVPIDVFISSPLQRAYVTTEKCAKRKGMEVSYTDPRLTEINYGLWTERPKKDMKKENPELYRLWKHEPWNVRFPEGESLQDIQQRYCEAIQEAVEKYPGKTIFIGAHSKGNITFLCSILGLSLEHYHQLPQSNTCVNVLEYKNGQWKIVLMNSISHLGKLYKYKMDKNAGGGFPAMKFAPAVSSEHTPAEYF